VSSHDYPKIYFRISGSCWEISPPSVAARFAKRMPILPRLQVAINSRFYVNLAISSFREKTGFFIKIALEMLELVEKPFCHES
jgi:hypothetical protein